MDVAIVRKEFPALLKCPDYVFGDAPTGTQCHYTVSEAMHKYLGRISHKMSLITFSDHKIFYQNFKIFHKKFQRASILVQIWNKIENFEAELHQK